MEMTAKSHQKFCWKMANVLAKIYQDIDCGLDGFFILICSQAPDKSNLYLGKKYVFLFQVAHNHLSVPRG